MKHLPTITTILTRLVILTGCTAPKYSDPDLHFQCKA